MHLVSQLPPVSQLSVGGRILHQHPKAVALVKGIGNVADDEVDAQRLSPGGQHLQCLRMAPVISQKDGGLALVQPEGERHCLGGGGRLIKQ